MTEHHKRTLAKTLSRRVFATCITISLIYIFTGELGLATGIGMLELVTKLIAYYGHERIWNSIHRGKQL